MINHRSYPLPASDVVLPQLAEKEEVREVTQVTFDFEHEGKKYPVVFDKEVDRTAVRRYICYVCMWLCACDVYMRMCACG